MATDETPICLDDQNDNEVEVPLTGEVNTEEEKKSTHKVRSIVWDHFPYVKGGPSAKCKHCNAVLACGTRKNGTSSLLSHLVNTCRSSPLYKKVDSKKQTHLSFKPKGTEAGGSLAKHSFSQDKCRLALTKMCIKDNRPFSIVDDEGFKEFVWELNPEFKILSRWTVARDCLSIYEQEAEKVKDMMKGQTVCLTTDTWSSVQNVNYMCLTAHWIDDDWTLQKKILNFCPIENYRGDTIGSLVYECIQNWGIDTVFTITVDNASSNDGAIRYLKRMLKGPNDILDCKYLHLRCCAHIINLVVRDGLEEQFDSVTRIRNAVTYVRSSPARYKTFEACIARVEIKCKQKPTLDVDTRWNSTYLMLETSVIYENAFERLYMIDSSYGAYFRTETEEDLEGSTRKRKRKAKVLSAPSGADWETSRNLIEYLKIFSDVTTKISGSKYVTSNIFFSELVKMHATIIRMCLSQNEQKKKMAMSMKAKYDKYWDNVDNMNYLLYVAVVLDPRNKLRYVNYCIETIYGKNSVKSKVILGNVTKTLEDLFNNYKSKAENMNMQNTQDCVFSEKSSSIGEMEIDLELEFDKYDDDGQDTKSEVEIYLADGKEKRDQPFDLLGWWKANSVKFPILSKLARHVLAMPISTVASESAFSTGGRVIDKYRSSLSTDTAEALICAQDWMRFTSVDLELGCTMRSKDIDELNEKMVAIKIDTLSKGKRSSNDTQQKRD